MGDEAGPLAAQIELMGRLGVTPPDLRSSWEGLARLREALSDRDCLLVVDDVWSAAAAEAFAAVGPRGRVLYPTRECLCPRQQPRRPRSGAGRRARARITGTREVPII